ncbi:hypothetical protein SAMD00019534_065440 [Acytostelium subglobosum LB1]|uniref:hypothetical protein n=1 Tax=Acytostelium subglobosum LB1 TaxID=1410327 RepID=UPI000644B441|nr:hypothetical protein SAMD00019534_065440 [Acytostelium subglobosum LB1]GAM23369.1 hypothetical protein SAMD00019534_065440 [Acytostelium subglobosum LB1]|eukprot:XP_012753818.1 hypothetical protein SAMD00019534_065440 [Acytostelium subglobosum LB1]
MSVQISPPQLRFKHVHGEDNKRLSFSVCNNGFNLVDMIVHIEELGHCVKLPDVRGDHWLSSIKYVDQIKRLLFQFQLKLSRNE